MDDRTETILAHLAAATAAQQLLLESLLADVRPAVFHAPVVADIRTCIRQAHALLAPTPAAVPPT